MARFAEQFGVDVSVIDDGMRDDFALATGKHQFDVVQMVWIADVAPRVRAALDALFGPSEWPEPARRYPVASVWDAIEDFMTAVARHRALDATLTELVRLRGARQHDCRLCCVAAVGRGDRPGRGRRRVRGRRRLRHERPAGGDARPRSRSWTR